jgi:hypothetical protein
MPSPLTQAGAITEPSEFAPLHTNRFMTGLWTNRNELRDAATPFLYEKFYSASRYDSLLGGLNGELTPKMSMARRAGFSVYNSQTFPAIRGFYGFRTFSTDSETIRLIADTAAHVYDATGPSRKLNIWNKAAGAGESVFQSVGNTMFWGDGVNQKKWLQTTTVWLASTLETAGTMIVDSNNNLQVAFGAVAAGIVSTTISDAPHAIGFPVTQSRVTIQLDTTTSPFLSGEVTFNGVTQATVLSGESFPFTNLGSGVIQVTVPYIPAVSTVADSGIAYTLGDDTTVTGTTGTTQPTWNTSPFSPTIDGSVIWICKGSSVQNWGIDPPTVAPTTAQVPLVNSFPAWAANTYYFTQQLIVDPSNTLLLQLLQDGVTASSPPGTFSPVIGHATTDGTAVWQTMYSGTPLSAWSPGDPISFGFNPYTTYTIGGTAYVFRVIQQGTTGSSAPAFTSTLNSLTNDADVVWQNVGPLLTRAAIGNSQAVARTQTVLDVSGYAQNIDISGISGASAPTWDDSSYGALTVDNTATWSTGDPVSIAATSTATYAFAWGSSTSNGVSTSSPRSLPILQRADNSVLVHGLAPSDPQDDLIIVYRTARGGSTLLYLDTIPAPANPSAGTWSYLDSQPDSALNDLLPAAVSSTNNPPPVGFRPLAYHLNRIFGAVGNVLSWSNGTNQTGNPNQSFTPSNNFVYPAKIVSAWACSLGLIVNTVSEVYIVLGSATDLDPLYTKKYIDGLGILSIHGFTVNKTTPYLMNSVKQVLALDPSSGLTEPGFPIADQFDNGFDPVTVQMAWHDGAHGDSALYVGDGIDSWYRMAALAAPESGQVWSTKGTLAVGYSAMSSVETSPGQRQLLFGPASAGPILFRDPTVKTDNGTTFPWYPIIGSIVLAQPGQLAELSFVTLESDRVGTRPTIGVLLGEIGGATSGNFEKLIQTRQDPPLLPPSLTLFNDRYDFMQNQKTVLCRHLQIRFDWLAEDAPNELLTYTIFGALHNEMKSQ